jgi:L-histidine Nalpha-methyltransferase
MSEPAVSSLAATNHAMLADVREGLSRARKELSPKYFYDQRGSELFDEITRLPEYYPTRTERAILAAQGRCVVRQLAPATIVELGAGNADKTRLLIDAQHDVVEHPCYVPIDVSASFLALSAERLRAEYPALRVVTVVGDIEDELRLPTLRRPALFAFLGSTIGNFDHPAAASLLRRVRRAMHVDDRLLLGADLRKDPHVIEAAYNDSRGVTAEFNRNMLRVLNRELGADFDLGAFAHRAFYDRELGRIEMHLVADRAHAVNIPGAGTFQFARGESVRTEISCKYDRNTIESLLSAAGLVLDRWDTDAACTYALALARRAG